MVLLLQYLEQILFLLLLQTNRSLRYDVFYHVCFTCM